MSNLLEQEIIKKYALTEEQINEITLNILNTLTYNKLPNQSPLAIVVGGQPGAGKTALINYTSKMSSERKFITVDNDFFRCFHPKADEIKELYPNYFTLATDQLGMGITSNVINYLVDNKYDLIFHQTLKNNRIGDDAITKFKESGYTVGVRAFAVPFYESSISQCERYLGQAEKLGYCRFATPEGHLTAYLGLPNTVEYLEQNGLYDFIEVYKRSEDISRPTLVYSNFNPQTKSSTLQALSNCEQITQDNNFGFSSAKEAVIKTRYETALQTTKHINDRICSVESSPYNNDDIQLRVNELKNSLEFVQNNTGISNQLSQVKSSPSYQERQDVKNYVDTTQQILLSNAQSTNTGVGCLQIFKDILNSTQT
ncbi:MAG: zeta toxin family protein [Clostridia bacterium]|nr:zeta toxin family protein [Clostridia bacterium]